MAANHFVVIARTKNGDLFVDPKVVEVDVNNAEKVVWLSPYDFKIKFPVASPFKWKKRSGKKNKNNNSGKTRDDVNNEDRFYYDIIVGSDTADPEVVIKK